MYKILRCDNIHLLIMCTSTLINHHGDCHHGVSRRESANDMTIASDTIRLIQSGLSNQDVLAALNEGLPKGSKPRGTKNTVAWYRSHLKHDTDRKIFVEARANQPSSLEHLAEYMPRDTSLDEFM